ncbi:hypothetical protein DL769_006143 [Monosporascus sp. CRB-8-3]|nr:hypothetical protein DL769_006143 [Monosporascus sp. CRB-8-3]
MRLINVETSRLEEFPDDRTPPYAILSHTWGSDFEELTFRDVDKGEMDKPGVGSVKFRGCCEQARNEGLKYIWIDTCCINKIDLVELSEAINSMFRWYRRASVCYAYLSDVPSDQDPREDGSKFRISRWFRRGWTLQELLAPKRLIFYSSEWRRLGTKVKLCTVIEGITGIPHLFLRGIDDLQSASVAQRMSWAAQRETKRKEDLAYCLLGIFGITMPMIYGEGGDRAFFRLQEQIMRSTRDHSILAWGLGGESTGHSAPSQARGFLAAAPSDFANSRNIVPRNQSAAYLDSLDISGGSLRASLSLFTASAETIGLLNCGPEGDTQRVVGIPLIKVTSGGSDEYIRPRGCRSVLRPIAESNTSRKSIYVKNDNGPDTQVSDQQGWVYSDDDFTDLHLKLVDVVPQSSWDEERAVIMSTTESEGNAAHPTVVRLRHDEDGSQDFILILEFQQQGTRVEAHHCVAICSRDTSLQELAGKVQHVTQKASGKRSASNGLLNLQLTLEPIAGRPIFTIRPEAMFHPPDVTIDATVELRKGATTDNDNATTNNDNDATNNDNATTNNDNDATNNDNATTNNDNATINNDNATWRLQQTLGGHSLSVYSVAFSHDSKLLALGSWKTVRLWDTATGRLEQTLGGHGKYVWSVAFSHDSKLLASGSKTTVQLWDMATGRLKQTLEGHYNYVSSVAFSHDSELLASGSVDSIVRLWDTATGCIKQTLNCNDYVSSVAFSHDSKLLASGSRDKTVRLWDMATGRQQQTLKGHNDSVLSVDFSHDSKLLASGSRDGTVRLWDKVINA